MDPFVKPAPLPAPVPVPVVPLRGLLEPPRHPAPGPLVRVTGQAVPGGSIGPAPPAPGGLGGRITQWTAGVYLDQRGGVVVTPLAATWLLPPAAGGITPPSLYGLGPAPTSPGPGVLPFRPPPSTLATVGHAAGKGFVVASLVGIAVSGIETAEALSWSDKRPDEPTRFALDSLRSAQRDQAALDYARLVQRQHQGITVQPADVLRRYIATAQTFRLSPIASSVFVATESRYLLPLPTVRSDTLSGVRQAEIQFALAAFYAANELNRRADVAARLLVWEAERRAATLTSYFGRTILGVGIGAVAADGLEMALLALDP